MKTMSLAIGLLCCLSCKSNDPVVGTWLLDDGNESIAMTFGADGRYSNETLIQRGQLSGMKVLKVGTWSSTGDKLTVIQEKVTATGIDPALSAGWLTFAAVTNNQPVSNSYSIPSHDELDATVADKKLVFKRKP